MPSGKRTRQRRREEAARKPPPVRSKSVGGRAVQLSQRTLLVVAAVLLVLAGLGVALGVVLSSGSSGSSGSPGLKGAIDPPPLGSMGFEGVPLETGKNLAPPGSPAPGQTVDGIQCGTSEQLAFHIHVRLTIFVNGREEKVPYGVGISQPQVTQTSRGPAVGSGACFSWLHTHAADGIVHIESPVVRRYTLGNFFDIWGQALSTTRVGPATGRVTVLVNGKVWNGDPRSVPLNAHSQIQLEVGEPLVKPVKIASWPPGL